MELRAVDGAKSALAKAEGRGKIRSSPAEERVGKAVRGFLGVGVGGGRRGPFLANSPEAEDQEEETGESGRYTAGERREDLSGAVVRGRRRRKEVSRGHSVNSSSVIGIIGSSLLSS